MHGVLKQLAGTEPVRNEPVRNEVASDSPAASAAEASVVEICERIVTADVLAEHVSDGTEVEVGSRAIVTPAGWDYARDHRIALRRGASKPQTSAVGQRVPVDSGASAQREALLIVVRSTPAVDRLYEDIKTGWRRELLGCPDDAASLAIGAASRGETDTVLILAEQSHRSACLANRNDAVKAVAVQDAADVRQVRTQLRANVWCVDPENMSWFELRNLVRAIGKP